VLQRLVTCLRDDIATELPLLWTIHPRTRSRLESFGLWDPICANPNIDLLAPLSYHEMLKLNMEADVMLTDSGGLQEECCALGTPCLTLRDNTERPVTLTDQGGLCMLVSNEPQRIRPAFHQLRALERRPHPLPHSDGHTADRVVEAILDADR
jgi:UDP-N-acetylglucosamine 2-epimerase (non-hydrolysing)